MDYDFYLRAYRGHAKLAAFSGPVLSVMRDTGISSRRDWPSLKKRLDEERKAQFKNAGNSAQRLAYQVYWPIYCRYRKLREMLTSRAG